MELRRYEEQTNALTSEEKKRIGEYYKDQINQLTKTIETLTSELQRKASSEKTQDGVQINTFNTQNFINMTPPSVRGTESTNSTEKSHGPIKVARPRKMSEDTYELKLLELEGKQNIPLGK